ncbi:uncharacterized protein MONOS_15856 [Monocercomonoides exilis]|uniref:uncharacterized protein n=1 Tax=Monocercomonoides exilis TaxID=2049356 RepID=UPI00355A6C9E|nr:hypothetical protein MONOS_15856 [Monocercomonoides exilis]|eukprot:MONOS_15856.1-p1 / transcript=MONOS_15856.1 / gene=MONOS_15856 / organism=Monocercomonoides_exilis_PA203 / gene_product=unspecified product / transcript_product=unspecified product / location=Mono_scaffold01381:3666-4007(-) / protein_length=114 / sequence_SO=supercontig / SO=protein_coding / is_pseudo=false
MEEQERLNQLDDDSDDEAEEEEEEEETDKGSTGKHLVLAMQNMIGGIADLATDELFTVSNKSAEMTSAIGGMFSFISEKKNKDDEDTDDESDEGSEEEKEEKEAEAFRKEDKI